ncbi:hypothetical protein REPUB_Repub08aG0056300 [Reevesia pubescens]
MVLEEGLGMNVNNGKSTKFWLDEWLPGGVLVSKAKKSLSEEEVELHVKDYFLENRGWDLSKLTEVLDQDAIEIIQARWIDIYSPIEDSVYWKLTADGNFSVQSAYH